MIFKKKPCHEVDKIMHYVNSKLHGLQNEKPVVHYKIHQEILEKFSKLLDNEEAISKISESLLAETTKLSDFDVNMSFMSEEIKSFAGEMTTVSEMNMAMVEQITASMDQVNESITIHSSTLNRITQQSNNLIQTNNHSIEQLQSINILKDDVVQDATRMSEKIEALVEMVNQVNGIVQGVESIAGQTNLLALNASIEAARAGEHGRGFAVVAEEIRKLADDTKKKLDGMRSFMASIHTAANEGKASMSNTLSSTMEMSDKIEVVNRSIQENVTNLQDTVESINNLSSAMHEISTSAEEINTAMKSAAEESEKISFMTQKILAQSETTAQSAKSISEIDDNLSHASKELNGLLTGGIHAMSNEKFLRYIEMAKEAHTRWLEKLKNMVRNQELRPLQTNSSKCAFGHLYHSIEVKHPDLVNDWNAIEQYHKSFHEQGAQVMKAIKNKAADKAESALKEASANSENIFSLFDSIAIKVKDLSKQGQQIFRA